MMTATVCTPLRSEWLALRDRVHTADLVRTGRATGNPRPGPVLVAGVAGALRDDLRPGDLVVATEVWRGGSAEGPRVPCPAAPIVAGELRRSGLRVHTGPVVTVDGIVNDPEPRRRLAASGALAVDNESALLASTDGSTVVVRGPGETETVRGPLQKSVVTDRRTDTVVRTETANRATTVTASGSTGTVTTEVTQPQRTVTETTTDRITVTDEVTVTVTGTVTVTDTVTATPPP